MMLIVLDDAINHHRWMSFIHRLRTGGIDQPSGNSSSFGARARSGAATFGWPPTKGAIGRANGSCAVRDVFFTGFQSIWIQIYAFEPEQDASSIYYHRRSRCCILLLHSSCCLDTADGSFGKLPTAQPGLRPPLLIEPEP